MGLRLRACDIRVLFAYKKLHAKKFHLWSTPVVFPFYRGYDVLRQSSAACKTLKVLETTVLKRLASAVQLRPWPP